MCQFLSSLIYLALDRSLNSIQRFIIIHVFFFFFFFFFVVVFFFFFSTQALLKFFEKIVINTGKAGVETLRTLLLIIGIKHGFSCIIIRQVSWEALKTATYGRGFQHHPRDLANVNALKKKKTCLIAIIA